MSEMANTRSIGNLDRAGACLSVACAVHCMAMPLVVAFLPAMGLAILADERTELILVLSSVLLAATSLCWGFRIHRRFTAMGVLLVGVVLLILGKVWAGEAFEWAFVALGASGLAAAHFVNRWLCRQCPCCGLKDVSHAKS